MEMQEPQRHPEEEVVDKVEFQVIQPDIQERHQVEVEVAVTKIIIPLQILVAVVVPVAR